jgi:hypothetical protein
MENGFRGKKRGDFNLHGTDYEQARRPPLVLRYRPGHLFVVVREHSYFVKRKMANRSDGSDTGISK